jgi:hypothetical protein
MRPLVEPRLPATRLIDGVAVRPDAPTEDEVGLANAGDLSYFHAIYFPRRFAADYRAGLLQEGDAARSASRERAIRRYVAGMSRRGSAPLLLKNPAYTASVDLLVRLFPGARIIHIHRDPREVFASTRRMLRIVLRELALQDHDEREIDAAILETYPLVMEALEAGRDRVPTDCFAELSYAALVEDPRAALSGLWHRLGLPGGEAALGAACDYCESLSDYRARSGQVDPAQVALLDERWPAQIAAYGHLSAEAPG